MATMIHTNKVPRDVLYWHDLTDDERTEFYWLDTEEEQAEATFFRYGGNVYALSEFMSCDGIADLKGWDGYYDESFFSAVLVRYVEDGEAVVIGLALS